MMLRVLFMVLKMSPARLSLWGLKLFFQQSVLCFWLGAQIKVKSYKKAVEGDLNPNIPTTYLQEHNNTTLVLDHQSASGLTRIKTPWITETVIGVTL